MLKSPVFKETQSRGHQHPCACPWCPQEKQEAGLAADSNALGSVVCPCLAMCHCLFLNENQTASIFLTCFLSTAHGNQESSPAYPEGSSQVIWGQGGTHLTMKCVHSVMDTQHRPSEPASLNQCFGIELPDPQESEKQQ